MFAIPGIIALVAFIYIRPQEVVTELQSIPLLYLFFALAVFGFLVDLRRSLTRFSLVPQTMWAVGYWLVCLVSLIAYGKSGVARGIIELSLPLILFGLVAHSVTTFRALHWLSGVIWALCFFLAMVCVYQARAPFGCVMVDRSVAGDLSTGTPDGRPCEMEFECHRDGEPGADYLCERIGLLGTTSIAGGRVRYRGVLQDPNEIALALTLGACLITGIALGKRRSWLWALTGLTWILVGLSVYYTRSRSGQLSFLGAGFIFLVYYFGRKALMAGVLGAIPLFLVVSSGSGRSDADSSTLERLEAWSAGLEMFRQNPVLGVGAGQFTEHHYLTAHNSFLLAGAETGVFGLFLWAMLMYLSIKICVKSVLLYRPVPSAQVAVSWAVTILACMVALLVGGFFISWTGHQILWLMLGLAGGLYSAIRTHDANFSIRLSFAELAAVGGGLFVMLAMLQLYVRYKGL